MVVYIVNFMNVRKVYYYFYYILVYYVCRVTCILKWKQNFLGKESDSVI